MYKERGNTEIVKNTNEVREIGASDKRSCIYKLFTTAIYLLAAVILAWCVWIYFQRYIMMYYNLVFG